MLKSVMPTKVQIIKERIVKEIEGVITSSQTAQESSDSPEAEMEKEEDYTLTSSWTKVRQ